MYRGPSGSSDGGYFGDGGPGDLAETEDLANQSGGPAILSVSLQKVAVSNPAVATLVTSPVLQISAVVSPGGESPILGVQALVSGQTVSTTLSLLSGMTYQGTVNLSSVRSGSFVVNVSATNTHNVKNTVAVHILYDSGPTITINSPLSAAAYRLSAPLLLVAQGTSTIAGGAISSLAATVQGKPLMLNTDKSNPYAWSGQGSIAFHDPVFTVALTGKQVVHVVSTDQNGASTAQDFPFTIDEQGPTVTWVNPLPGSIIGNVITINVTVADPAGVADGSVTAVWLNDPADYSVQLTRVGTSDTFTARFDLRRLPNPLTLILPALDIRAQDTLGNQSDLGAEFILDNTPPVMALNPPITQVRKINPLGGYDCSSQFNPVGPNTVRDLSVNPQLLVIRARISDRGNTAQGQRYEYISPIDPTTTDLLMTPLDLSGKGPPLVVDADGKGTCNNLNPNLMPTSMLTMSGQALVLRLSVLLNTGTAVYSQTPLPQFTGACSLGTSGMAKGLCDLISATEPDFTFALPTEIFSLGPFSAVDCAGLQLDTLNLLPEGPFCAAVRASDLPGNANVSVPIRICIERPLGDGACAAFKTAVMNGSLPTCIGKLDTTGAVVPGKSCTMNPATPYPLQREPEIF